MVAVLPPDLASEANMLRQELEDRHRRIMQERLYNQGSDPLAALIRHAGTPILHVYIEIVLVSFSVEEDYFFISRFFFLFLSYKKFMKFVPRLLF